MDAVAVQKYTAPGRYMHWAVAGLIALQFILAQLAERAEEAGAPLRQLALLANHKSVGMTVLMLALVRIAWRLSHPAPTPPATMPVWQRRTAATAHVSLYGLLFAMPITGWLMSSASAYTVSWFNLFAFPDLVASSAALKDTLAEIHETLAGVLAALAALHIGAALWHHFKEKDEVLHRMTSMGSVTLGCGLLAIGITALAIIGPSGGPPVSAEATRSPDRVVTQQVPITTSDLLMWSIAYADSEISFSAEQAGAIFTGHFSTWQAHIQFEPENLPASSALVEIELSSVQTGDSDRDATLGQPDWFAAGVARFSVGKFEKLDSGATPTFRTIGATLSFGGAAHPVELTFSLTQNESTRVLEGTARLDRLALGVGTGEWTDTTWVGQFVDVLVRVVAKP
ncbi:MAG: hypothetical protein GKR90_07290 [Pseudomonadales bacterium]|nr:hypothetical protein [Pseudomonadales bacterium]